MYKPRPSLTGRCRRSVDVGGGVAHVAAGQSAGHRGTAPVSCKYYKLKSNANIYMKNMLRTNEWRRRVTLPRNQPNGEGCSETEKTVRVAALMAPV